MFIFIMVELTRYPVTIADKRYSVSFQEDEAHALAWQHVLQFAHDRKSPVICRCIGKAGIALTVRHNGTRYSLAKIANTGHLHRPECRYHKERTESSGRRFYMGEAITGKESAYTVLSDIKFNQAPIPDHKEIAKTEKVADLSILGLLHFIWSRASLNFWVNEWQRPESRVAWQISEAAKTIWLDDSPLAERLVTLFEKDKAAPPLIEKAKTSQSRVLLLGEISKISDVAIPEHLTFTNSSTLGRIYLANGLWDRLVSRFPNEVEDWRKGESVVALALCLPHETKNYLRCVDIALMSLGRRYIPVENQYERNLVDKLLAEKRSFSKPLRYDAPKSAPLPSFILSDTETRDTPLMVADTRKISEKEIGRYVNAVFKLRYMWLWRLEEVYQTPNLPLPKDKDAE